MTFTISRNEIARRIKAFINLLISVLVGMFVWPMITDYHISAYGYASVILTMIFISLLSINFFITISQQKISISDKKIEKSSKKAKDSYMISEISTIKIKRRITGDIREIYIKFHNQKTLVITALEGNFESFIQTLKSKINKSVIITEKCEPIDFDSPFFYPILGLLLSLFGVLIGQLFSGLSFEQIRIIVLAFSIYVMVMGLYLICTKPISARSGQNNAKVDYIVSTIFLCAGIFLFVTQIAV